MYKVYVLRSQKIKSHLYIGVTGNLKARLAEHNRGEETYTKKLVPWELETYVAFKDRETAFAFEKYLKHGSGHAFLKKRLLPKNSF